MKKVLLIDSYSKVIKNRFEICVVAAERAKAILFSNNSFGTSSKKEVCTALEEMKDDVVDIDAVKCNMAKSAIAQKTSEAGFLDVSKSLQEGTDDFGSDVELGFEMFADQNVEE